jgi:hypothetical protein
MLRIVAHRNPDWIGGHREIERRLAEIRWFRLACVLWGVLSLAALIAFQLGAWPDLFAFLSNMPRWEALRDLNSLFLMVGLAYLAGCSLLFYRWLHANIPLASSPGGARTPVQRRPCATNAPIRGLRSDRPSSRRLDRSGCRRSLRHSRVLGRGRVPVPHLGPVCVVRDQGRPAEARRSGPQPWTGLSPDRSSPGICGAAAAAVQQRHLSRVPERAPRVA